MTEIIFATGNKDKMREIREIMADCDVHIVSMKEAGIRKSQGIKQLMSGGGVILIGTQLIPLLSGLFG